MDITPEMQAVIDAAVESATAKLNDHNSKLVGEIRTLKNANKQAEDDAAQAKADKAERDGDFETYKTTIEKKHATAISKLNDQIATLTSTISTYKIDAVIADAMTKAGVLPDAISTVADHLKSGVTMENGEAVYNGAPLSDRINTYLASPAAKIFCSAPQNSGGGATGSAARAGTTMSKAPTNSQEMEQFANIVRDNPEQAKSLARSWGWPDLSI